jgi:hypothetical protein
MIKAEIESSVTLGNLSQWFGVCYKCHHALPPLDVTATPYFELGAIECVGCHGKVDLWECVKSSVGDDYPPEWGLHSLGANLNIFPFEVRPGQVVTVDLTQHGIPANAILLYSSYQSDDVSSIPRLIELYSKHLAYEPSRQAVYCMPVQGRSMEPGPGRATICWIERATDSQASLRLANAFRDVAAHDLEGAVVEAFSGFEIALFTFLSRYLERTCTSTTFRRALEGRLSAYAMMELLPEICEEHKLPSPPKAVTTTLHGLRQCRNNLLHKGRGHAVTASLVGEFLSAALVGVAFIRYVEQRAV